MDGGERGALVYNVTSPAPHRAKLLHGTGSPWTLEKEAERRADVVGTFPSELSIVRPIGAAPASGTDGTAPQRR